MKTRYSPGVPDQGLRGSILLLYVRQTCGDQTRWATTPALVLSWCHLNNRKYNGDQHRAIHEAYKKAGLADRCLYFSSPKAGHEYDVYHVNEIMKFFDKYCK